MALAGGFSGGGSGGGGGSTTGITNGSNAAAGQIGEYLYANCNNNNNFGTGTTITMTIATPGVVTWTGYPMSGYGSGGAFSGWTCPINFTTTGALPTGVVAGTTYYIIPIDANTFQLATSAANALAGTAIATSGTQSGTHTGFGYTSAFTTGVAKDTGAIQLTPGDWDVGGCQGAYVTASTTLNNSGGSIGTTSSTLTNQPFNSLGFNQQALVPNTSGGVTEVWCGSKGRFNVTTNTPIYDVVFYGFSGGTGVFGYGAINARRMR